MLDSATSGSAGTRRDKAATRHIGGWLLLCALLSACTTSQKHVDSSVAGSPATASTEASQTTGWLNSGPLPAVLRLPAWPATKSQLASTSEGVYLANLSARIDHLEQSYAASPAPDLGQALAMSLMHRFRILGVLADVERAGRILQEQLQQHPQHAQLRLARASWFAMFHRFEQAQQMLQDIEPADAAARAMAQTLASEIDLALGHYQLLGEAFAHPEHEAPADLYALAARGNAAVLHGDLESASRLFFEAQSQYRDVGPFPLAWLHTQQGIALLRFGHYDAAIRFFDAAHERLPSYYLATEHLAECLAEVKRFDRARELYLQVIEQTDNPQFMAALAAVEHALGKLDEAARWREAASVGYEQLLQRYPDAYAQHAAEFFLEIGQIPRARSLAERNLALRQDVGSRLLRAEVALAEDDSATSCVQLAAVESIGLRPPELVGLRERSACAAASEAARP